MATKIEVKPVQLSGGFTVEESKKKGKVHKYEDRSAFIGNLPEGLNENVVKGVNHYQGKYVSGCLDATVKLADKEFKKGEDVVTANYPFGANANSSVTVQIAKKVKQTVPTENGVKQVEAPQIRIKVKENYHGAPSKGFIGEIKNKIDSEHNK